MKMCNKISIILIMILTLALSSCSYQSNNSKLSIDDVKSNAVNYLTQHNYKIEINSSDTDEFSIKCKKNNKTISINCINISSDYRRCTIIVYSSIENLNQKYKNIDYKELYELSQIIGIEKITDDTIKTACEDKRDFYDSTDDNYSPPSDKFMSKIYRMGFFENPVIMYDLTYNTETVSIYWNA